MGKLDGAEPFRQQAQKSIHIKGPASFNGQTVLPYLVPEPGKLSAIKSDFTGTRSTSVGGPPTRYAGRSQRVVSTAAGSVGSAVALDEPAPRQGLRPPVTIGQPFTRSVSVPWSFRLILAVSLLSILLVALRVTGLFTPPLDTIGGAESTHAAFVDVLTGQTSAPAEAARLLPPTPPWLGPSPIVPSSTLPLYDWITGLFMLVFGTSAWIGRVVALVFSLLGGLALFATVRRTAGARAALYALLLYSVAPLSVVLGQQFSPASLILASQGWVLLAVVRWRTLADSNSQPGLRPAPRALSMWLAMLSALFLGLVDPGAIFMAVPLLYVMLAPQPAEAVRRAGTGASPSFRDAWESSRHRGFALALVCALVGPSLLWWVYTQGSAALMPLATGDGGGAWAVVSALLSGGTYVQVVGLLVEQILSVAGLLLLGAGLLHAARPPVQLLFHAWLAGALLHVLTDASRLPDHVEVLLPLIMPVCALAGIGAAWAGALPARVWLAMKEQKRDEDADFAVSPHTSWLLDLPEERTYSHKSARPQAQLALSKSVANRNKIEVVRFHRVWLLALGHLIVFAVLALIVAGGMPSLVASLQPSERAAEIATTGSDLQTLVPRGDRMVVAGPLAPQIFYSSQRTGWALPAADFSMARIEELKSEGASYLVSADQDWLGRQTDYRGLITSYSVIKLTKNYILFDLNARPSDSDRLYFLESGHTLGGAFRTFWERNGGVSKLGYPISEELAVQNPLDGQTRTVQYFERAVLEYHQEHAGTADEVMLASVGLWITKGRDFPRTAPFQSTADRWYFAETGHMVKEAFLRYWQQQGGVALFGYPISEELPEINPGDGKVYTVQYFERARFEWHPTFAGTPDEVQLGLIGKQALEMPGK